VVYEQPLNGVNAALVLGAAIPSLFLAVKIRLRPYRTFAILLAGFLAIHGVYHLLEFLDLSFGVSTYGLSDVVVEPLSYLLLLAFAVYYYRRS
jgi:hypothetical protein